MDSFTLKSAIISITNTLQTQHIINESHGKQIQDLAQMIRMMSSCVEELTEIARKQDMEIRALKRIHEPLNNLN